MFKRIWIIILAILFLTFPYFILEGKWWWGSFSLSELDDYGNFGEYIGGIASLIGFTLLYFTYNAQRKELLQTRKQNFENLFFQMMNIHSRNVSEMSLEWKNKTYTGRDVFKVLLIKFNRIFRGVIMKFNAGTKLDEGDKVYKELVGISNLILFFGIEGEDLILKLIKTKSFEIDVKGVKAYLKELAKKKRSMGQYFLEDHQVLLGHYYRHLYRTVKFVDQYDIAVLDQREKNFYIKTLRSQFSNPELALMLTNSLSPLGKNWIEYCEPSLIEKYALLKNLTLGQVREPNHDVNHMRIYPSCIYEGYKEPYKSTKVYRKWIEKKKN